MENTWPENQEPAGAYLEFMQCPKCGHAGAYFTSSMFADSEFFAADMESEVEYTYVCGDSTCAYEWKES